MSATVETETNSSELSLQPEKFYTVLHKLCLF